MKKLVSNKKGITLIALVITIVVLMILAGVLINITLGNNGIINRVKQAKSEHIKAQYYEEIQLEILNEQAERIEKPKEELFITSIKYRLEGTPQEAVNPSTVYVKKAWVDSVENYLNLNRTLIVYTVEGYQLYINFDNANNQATILEDSFRKTEEGNVTITYSANYQGGTENTVSNLRKGLSINLAPSNTFTRPNYTFVGWYKNEEATGDRYTAGSAYTVTEDETFYAKWSQHAVTITYTGDGTEELPEETVEIRDSIDLPVLARDRYVFKGWKDQNNQTYTEESGLTISPTTDLTLTAQWDFATYEITLNNQSATSAGTTTIYEKYSTGYYTDSECTTQMSTTANGITVPTKSNYTFGGYYTSTGGAGTQYIDANGKLTSSASTTNFTDTGTLYAKWIPILELTVRRNMAKSSTSGEVSAIINGTTYSSTSGTTSGDWKSYTVRLTLPTGTAIKLVGVSGKNWRINDTSVGSGKYLNAKMGSTSMTLIYDSGGYQAEHWVWTYNGSLTNVSTTN